MSRKSNRTRSYSRSIESLKNRRLLAGMQINIPRMLPTTKLAEAVASASASVQSAAGAVAAAKPAAAPLATTPVVMNSGALSLPVGLPANNNAGVPLVVAAPATLVPANAQPAHSKPIAIGIPMTTNAATAPAPAVGTPASGVASALPGVVVVTKPTMVAVKVPVLGRTIWFVMPTLGC